jgi:hypothetical protein
MVDATSITDAGFTADTDLDFTAPQDGSTGAALDGNIVANQANPSDTITGISWAPGQTLWLRWTDINDASNDDGLGIDNLSFSATASSTGNSGDYDNNMSVDAADYVLWRKTFNESVPANTGADGDGDGTIDDGDYDHWRARFGNTVPGAGASQAVAVESIQVVVPAPEPSLVAAVSADSGLESSAKASVATSVAARSEALGSFAASGEESSVAKRRSNGASGFGARAGDAGQFARIRDLILTRLQQKSQDVAPSSEDTSGDGTDSEATDRCFAALAGELANRWSGLKS